MHHKEYLAVLIYNTLHYKENNLRVVLNVNVEFCDLVKLNSSRVNLTLG